MMKNLNSILAIFFSVLLYSNITVAQTEFYGENPEECKQRMSIMTAYYKQNAYSEAAPSWRIVLSTCPQSTKNVYIIGNKIMRDFIAKSSDAVLKEKYIDTLLMLHDMRIQYFPDNQANKLKAKKAADLLYYRPKTGQEEAFKLFEVAVKEGVSELDKVDLGYYLKSYTAMVELNKKTCGEYLVEYFRIAELIKALSTEDEVVADSESSKQPVCFDCITLDSLFNADFEINKNDTVWLDNGITFLKNCKSSNTFLKLSEKRFATKPSAKTATLLGTYFYSVKNKTKAEFYFDKAIELESDNDKKGGHYINKAKLHLSEGEYSQAKNAAAKALSYPGSSFDAYLIMGDAVAYSSSSCKGLTFGGKEVFWVAVDYFNKASNAATDPADKTTANKRIAKYSAYFPEKSELFLKSLTDGNSYRVECWVTETTTVRSK